MFLNFLLNDTMKEMSGIDIQHVRSKAISDLECERGGGEWLGKVVPELNGFKGFAL